MITIVVSSKKPLAENAQWLALLEQTVSEPINIDYIQNNGESGLTTVYNEALKRANTDIVVFIHDDVQILTYGWNATLKRLFNINKNCCIIGLAGSDKYNGCGWWHNGNHYGTVFHKHNGQIFMSRYSGQIENIEKVVTVDGLFLAVKKDRLKSGFNTSINGFHFYDVVFCLDNYLKGVEIGVTTKIIALHASIGNCNEEWQNTNAIVYNMYQNYLPITTVKNNNNFF